MVEVVFALGRPGSGKSAVARYLKEIAQQQSIPFLHTGDYHILYGMYEVADKRFKPSDPENPLLGFTVEDPSVFEEALNQMQKEVAKINEGIVVVEFAPPDYKAAFERFPADFYKGSHIMFFESDMETCKRRISERVSGIRNLTSDKALENVVDNHFISDEVMDRYYSKDFWEYMTSPDGFKKDLSIEPSRFFASKNPSTQEALLEQVAAFAKPIIQRAKGHTDITKAAAEVIPHPVSVTHGFTPEHMNELRGCGALLQKLTQGVSDAIEHASSHLRFSNRDRNQRQDPPAH